MNENLNLNENTEIQEALKEFEIKNAGQNVQDTPVVSKGPQESKMVLFVMKYSGGLIKDEKGAEYTLLGFAVLAFAVSLYLFFR